MAREGWIKLHRKIIDSALYKSLDSKQRDIMIQCLLLANHTENEWIFHGNTYKCKAGQFYTSLSEIKEKCSKDVTLQNIRTCFSILEKCKFLTKESTNKNSLITITKWASYQDKQSETNTQPNRQLTSDQQALNKQLTTIKKDKEEEEGKEGKEITGFDLEKIYSYSYQEYKTILNGQSYKLSEIVFIKWKEFVDFIRNNGYDEIFKAKFVSPIDFGILLTEKNFLENRWGMVIEKILSSGVNPSQNLFFRIPQFIGYSERGLGVVPPLIVKTPKTREQIESEAQAWLNED